MDGVEADMASPADAAGIDELLVIPAIAPDGSLFPIGKMEAHRQGQQHLAVSVFVFAGDKLLIQQRADGKYHCGGQWANTCCSHPHWGETPADCANRRLGEEVGLALPLAFRSIVEYQADVGTGLIENERVHVFRGELDETADVSGFDPAEVQAVRWVHPRDLMREADMKPGLFTPWLRIYLQRWSELGLRTA
jgi:isopentenyl-diphosphate delta-isomerase